jgi:hypothetical protein
MGKRLLSLPLPRHQASAGQLDPPRVSHHKLELSGAKRAKSLLAIMPYAWESTAMAATKGGPTLHPQARGGRAPAGPGKTDAR